MRKLLVAICLASLLPLSALAATKTTVSQLNKLLASLYEQRKPDDAVATKLKDVELTEQLTPPAMNNLMQYKPGLFTVRQLLLLSVDSSLLPPPPDDLPTAPAPNAAAQTSLIQRAVAYAVHDTAHLPRLSAEKQSLRFQNGVAYIKNTSGNGSSMSSSDTPADIAERVYPALIGQQTDKVITEAGVEQPPPNVKQKNPASQFGQVSQGLPGLPLTTVLTDAQTAPISWLRWQTVNGRQTAVFTFTVGPSQSHYKLNYCCFPSMEHVGSGMGFQSNSGTVTSFTPYQAARGYHGELFIDSATGIILRLITRADTKPTDFVQQEDIRIDFTAVAVGNSHYILPTKSMILTTVVPNGDAYVKFSTRRTLFDVTYSKYQPITATK